MKTIKGNTLKLHSAFNNYYWWKGNSKWWVGTIINNNFIVEVGMNNLLILTKELDNKKIPYKIKMRFIIIISPKYFYISDDNGK